MKPALVWSTRRYSLRKVGSAAVRIHTIKSSFWKPLLSVLFGSSSHTFLLQDSGFANPLKAVTSTNAQDLDPIIFILKLNIMIYDTEIKTKRMSVIMEQSKWDMWQISRQWDKLFFSTFIPPCQSSFQHCSIFMFIHLPSTLYVYTLHTYLLTPSSRVLLEKLTSKLCS